MNRSGQGVRRGLPVPGVAVPPDKRFRRSELRPDRRRLGRTIVRIARWVVPGLAGLAAAVWLVDALLHATALTVKHVSVSGNVRLASADVQALVDDIRGENIFQVDFEKYRRRVMDSPWVADVTLGRVLPATVEVRVVERVPLAVARLDQQLFLIDSAGVIIDEYSSQYRDFDLPIIDGLVSSASASTDGPLIDRERVSLTHALLNALAVRPDLRRRLSQVDASNAHDAVVMFDSEAAWLHLGESRFVERLTTYLELAPTLAERFQDIDYVDLRFDDRVFVHSRGRTDQAARQTP